MLVKNNAKRPVQHSFYNDKQELIIVEIAGGEVKEIQDDIAKLWLKHGFVVEYVEPKKAKEEKEELLAEIAELKAKLADKENKPQKEDDTHPLDIKALKTEADSLGIKYNNNIGAEKLLAKITEYKEKEGQTEE